MSLYAVGDIHGNVDNANRVVGPLVPSLTTSDTLVLLGDVGIAYGDHVHGSLRKYLARLPCRVLVMRGNHDTRYWRDMQFGTLSSGHTETVDWSGSVFMRDSRFPNTLYVHDDGDLVTIEGHPCLCIPGAWSIDGDYRRMMGYPWEPEEQLTATERNRLLGLAETNTIEFIFSHTCPFDWMSTYLGDRLIPTEVMPVTDCTMELWMDDVLDTCASLKDWYFGHFHDDRDVAFGLGHLLYQHVRKVF